MYLKALLLLTSTITAQAVSTNWLPGTADFSYQLNLSGNLLTVWVQKRRPGFLAFGFGSGIENGDIFVIQTNGGGLSIQSCQLAGQQTPTCGGSLWVLQIGTLNSDGSWTAQVTRDITQASASNITITPNAINNLLYYYGDSETLDIGQNTPSDMFGTLQAYLGQDIPTSIDSANPPNSTTNPGDNSTDPSSGPIFGAGPNGTTNGTTSANSTTNADGSVTTTVLNADGSTTATTVYRNGSIIITTTASNGTVTTNTTTSTNVNSNGTITTNTTVTNTTGNNTSNPDTTNNGQNNNGQNGFSGVLKAASVTLVSLLVTLWIN